MTRPEPDLAGYREAQLTLIAKLGADVPFFTPLPESWDPDVPLDPETSRPFDPSIEPLASGWASASVRCGVAIRPLGVNEDATMTALGLMEEGKGLLLVPKLAYEENNLAGATECEVHGERWTIEQRDLDGIGSEAHRYLVHISQL
jgi:hypothetical protein